MYPLARTHESVEIHRLTPFSPQRNQLSAVNGFAGFTYDASGT